MTGRARLLLLAVLVAVVFGLWYANTRAPRGERPTAGTTIVMLGDSLVEGVGASRGRELPALLAERLGRNVVNAGRRGDTAAAALARLEADVLSRDPRVVVVLVGGNDFLRRVPRATTFEALGTIAERLRSRGAGVVIVGVSLGLFTDEYGPDYAQVARRTGSALVPDVLGGILGKDELMADQIHPNDRGYALMADRIAPAVRALLE